MDIKPITQICLNVTDECNCACTYCFTQHRPNRMTYKVAEDTAEWLLKNADGKEIPSIGFFGGEPTLEWDTIIVPIIEKYYRKINFAITSNTTLMTEERLKYLADHNVSYLFSIDGNEFSQNINRPMKDGSESFEKIKDLIPLVAKYFPGCTFRSTITPSTCNRIFENIEFASSQGFKIIFQIPNSFDNWSEEDLKTIEREVTKYSLYLINAFLNSYSFIRYFPLELAFNKIHRLLSFQKYETKDEKTLQRCGLGRSGYASVNYKGEIFGCQEMDTRDDGDYFRLGSIYNGLDNAALERLANDFQQQDNYSEYCEDCLLKDLCANDSCVANNYISYKDINRCNPIICWWNNLLLKEALFICNILGNAKNENFKEYFYSLRTEVM